MSALLTPVVRILAMRLGAVSLPGGRNVNSRPVPRYGGIAICVAVLAAIAVAYVADWGASGTLHNELRRVAALLLGGVGLCAVGALDDTRSIPALHKLLAQVAAALGAYACGFRIDAVLLPFLGTLPMGVFALPVTVLWIVGITNAINLIDGLDGLAGGVVFFASFVNLVVAYMTGATFVGVTMSAMLGAVAGFLLFNFNPARIFMGDSGSYFLGFVLGTVSLASASRTSTAVSLLVPILALGVPIVDTLFSIVRRVLERRSLFSPDRGHIHHRLLDMGITHRRAVLILYGISLVLTAAAVCVALGRSWTVGLALLVACVVVFGMVRFVGYFEYLFRTGRVQARLRSHHSELLRRVVPELPELFASASSEEEVWKVLRGVLARTDIASAELMAMADVAETEIAHWGAAAADQRRDSHVVSIRYPVGDDARARTALRFRWRSDSGEVSQHTDVLLQLVVDLTARALERVGSLHAPGLDAEVVADRPSGLLDAHELS